MYAFGCYSTLTKTWQDASTWPNLFILKIPYSKDLIFFGFDEYNFFVVHSSRLLLMTDSESWGKYK